MASDQEAIKQFDSLEDATLLNNPQECKYYYDILRKNFNSENYARAQRIVSIITKKTEDYLTMRVARSYRDGFGINVDLNKSISIMETVVLNNAGYACEYIEMILDMDSIDLESKYYFLKGVKKTTRMFKIKLLKLQHRVLVNPKYTKLREEYSSFNNYLRMLSFYLTNVPDIRGHSKPYDPSTILISLGYNCEISQIMTHMYGKIDSYVWSWAYSEDLDGLCQTLVNPLRILNSPFDYAFDEIGLKFLDYSISFHARKKIKRLSLDDTYVDELLSRVEHLSVKYLKLDCKKKKLVFILKIPNTYRKDVQKYIDLIDKSLKTHFTSYELIVVLPKNGEYNNPKKTTRYKIEYVDYYSDARLTDIDSCYSQWIGILSKYQAFDSDDFRYRLYNQLLDRLYNYRSYFDDLVPRIVTQLKSL